eukprot:TRINITY_DN12042_c0_g5_i1.p1 TRINITY_DN12042_c0_g5~~TRINITY_DN12042_c0_g5_i1.p1  ORF type:complete len:712 (+),score=156.65 TRINITY_DN12042_c0_g5_i1:90-2138(+)
MPAPRGGGGAGVEDCPPRFPDWLLPPDRLPAPEHGGVPAGARDTAAALLFASWNHAGRDWADLFALQTALLSLGAPFTAHWAREAMARVACWLRAAGRGNQLPAPAFRALLTQLTCLHDSDELRDTAAELAERGGRDREWAECIEHAGDDVRARTMRAAARAARRMDGDNEGALRLPLLRLACSRAAASGEAGAETAGSRHQRASSWAHPLRAVSGGSEAGDTDGSADSVPSDAEWRPWRPRSPGGAMPSTMRESVARLRGQRRFFGPQWWRRRVSIPDAGRLMLHALADLEPRALGEGLKRLKAALAQVEGEYAGLCAEAGERRAKPYLPHPEVPHGDSGTLVDWVATPRTASTRSIASPQAEGRLFPVAPPPRLQAAAPSHLQCVFCGRCLLRAGPDGRGLFWEGGVGGAESRALTCPGCLREHRQWVPVAARSATCRLARAGGPLAIRWSPLSIDVEERERLRPSWVQLEPPWPYPRKRNPQRAPRAPRPPAPASSPTVKRLALPITLRCTHCQRSVLNADHQGDPLPPHPVAPTGPGGAVLPLRCPGCEREHHDWETAGAFAADGRAAAFVGTERSRPWRRESGTAAAASTCRQQPQPQPAAPPPAAAAPDPGSSAQRYLECGECGRLMLRQGAEGDGLPLHFNAFGGFTPLDCPGCQRRHLNWTHRADPPLAVFGST